MEDRCVCCGEIVPEGRMICINCYYETMKHFLKEYNEEQEVSMDNDR